jgi:hypothetical protein
MDDTEEEDDPNSRADKDSHEVGQLDQESLLDPLDSFHEAQGRQRACFFLKKKNFRIVSSRLVSSSDGAFFCWLQSCKFRGLQRKSFTGND